MDSEFLQTVPFFKHVASEDLEDISTLFKRSEYRAGDVVLQEGVRNERLHLVTRGVVHVRRISGGKEVLLARIPKGGFFGEMNLYSGGEATASIYAMDTVWLDSVHFEEFKAWMNEHPAAGYRIVSYLLAETSERLRQTNDRLVNSVFWATS